MEGSSSDSIMEARESWRRSKEHERHTGDNIALPEEGSSCVDDSTEPDSKSVWKGYIESAEKAFDSYKMLMQTTLDTLSSQLAQETLDEASKAKGIELLENIKENMKLFICEEIIGEERASTTRERNDRGARRAREARTQEANDSDDRRRRLHRRPKYVRGERMPDPQLSVPFDRDVKLMVKFPKGKTTAFVKLDTNDLDERFEGPIQLSATLSDILKLKRVERVKVDETSSDSDSDSDSDSSVSDDGKDKGPSSNDKDPPPDDKGPPPDDDKPPKRIITAPWRPIKSPSSRSAEKKDRDVKKEYHDDDKKVQEEASVVPLPRYKPGQIVYYWCTKSQQYWVGVIRCVRYPTFTDRVMETHRYEIEPEGESSTNRLPCVLVLQRDIRPLEWAITHLCLPKTNNNKVILTCISKLGLANLDRGVSLDNNKRHEWIWRELRKHGPICNTTRLTPCLPISGTSPLLPLRCVGIDTCSALSVSTERRDFTFLDESLMARESVSLRGIGGEQSTIGGRGPMLISALDKKGHQVFMVDVAGVYLNKAESLQLRILSQQRMKAVGFDLVQNKYGDGEDFLVYRNQSENEDGKDTVIPLKTDDGILVLNTIKISLKDPRQKCQIMIIYILPYRTFLLYYSTTLL
jgi:hypothetical protein